MFVPFSRFSSSLFLCGLLVVGKASCLSLAFFFLEQEKLFGLVCFSVIDSMIIGEGAEV